VQDTATHDELDTNAADTNTTYGSWPSAASAPPYARPRLACTAGGGTDGARTATTSNTPSTRAERPGEFIASRLFFFSAAAGGYPALPPRPSDNKNL